MLSLLGVVLIRNSCDGFYRVWNEILVSLIYTLSSNRPISTLQAYESDSYIWHRAVARLATGHIT